MFCYEILGISPTVSSSYAPATVRVPLREPGSRKEADPGNDTYACRGWTPDRSRSRRGDWAITRKTAGQRLYRAQKVRWPWCCSARHTSLPEPYRQWCQTRRGHYQDDGIRGHDRRLPPALHVCSEGLAVLAEASQPYERSPLGDVRPAARQISAASTQNRPRHLRTSAGQPSAASEWCGDAGDRRTGCLHRTPPGLWGAGG